jgi:monoamine oxidase
MGKQRMTRRQFLQGIAQVGGIDAAYGWLHDSGLIADSTYRRRIRLQGNGAGQRVIILGAGLAGLVAAYELDKLGYECVVLEAQARAGGRCWSVRRGDIIEEVGHDPQVCQFDDGFFFNPGPSRIPYHHRGVLSYCKEFGIEMEVFTNFNRGAFFYNSKITDALTDEAIENRAVQMDMRGYTAELLSKALSQGALDTELTPEDQERMIEFMRSYGDLSPDLFYRGSPNRGYAVPPGAGLQAGEIATPYDLDLLLRTEFWRYFHTEWGYNEQMTMLTPVEGMDRIAAGFVERIGHLIQYRAEVRGIFRNESGARIVYQSLDTNETHEIAAPYCICTIPLPVLAYIPSDFPPALTNAIINVSYGTGTRVAMQFSRRFWEEDHGLYGGISWTDMLIQQMHYAPTNFMTDKGVFLTAYPFGSKAYELANFPPPERHERVLQDGERIHPAMRETYENGVSCAWHLIPYALGCYTAYGEVARANFYPVLNETDGVFYLAGEHMSYLIGWQEGAILSGIETVEKIHARVQEANA